MRIGIDMLAVQSPESRHRGVGRFGQNLVSAMLGRDTKNTYLLYAHEGFPSDQIPQSDNAETVMLARGCDRGELELRHAMDRLARTNPDGLDVLLLLNPFELCSGYEPPAKPIGGPALAALMHDLIPFIYQEKYLRNPETAAWFYRRLRSMKGYDLLVTNSESTRGDCLEKMNVQPDRVVTILGGSDGGFFVPDRTLPIPVDVRSTLARLGISRPYVFSVAAADDRKNLWGLLDAFRLLQPGLRLGHQIVVTCHLNPSDERQVRDFAADRGLADALILTGAISDATLRTLYQRCAVFAFPSLHEGLGLPLLEAMNCGAPVIAGNNSAQIEVVGDAGILVNAHDSADIAAHLTALLSQPENARGLGDRGLKRASQFTWDRSAGLAIAALERLKKARSRRLRIDRPRIAVVSPFAPKKSGVSTYAGRLVRELCKRYHVDLYHDEGYVPDLGLDAGGFSAFDHRLFARFSRIRDYRGVLYQMGNSPYHGFLYEMMQEHPGIVTLHDFSLAGFQFLHAHRSGDPLENFRREIEYAEAARASEIAPNVAAWSREPGGIQDALTRRGIHLNRRVFECSQKVIVHSPWCLQQAVAADPSYGEKTVVIPHSARPVLVSGESRCRTRERFGLDRDGLLIASFGILSRGKMNVEAIRAFAAIAPEFPGATFLLVGQDWEQGEAAREVEALGLEGRIRLLGHQSEGDFCDLIAATDIGVALRRPPTYGETSAPSSTCCAMAWRPS